MTSTNTSTLRYTTALTIGFLALATAIVAAYREPATGFELSIYASTPILFWIGVGVAIVLALAVVAAAPRGEFSSLALALASGAVLAIVGIPTLRSYAFFGGGDSLTHLGWARELNAGILDPLEFIYPAIHLIANFMAEFGGIALDRSLVIIPTVLYPIVAVVFFGLAVTTISDSRWALPIGVLTALLFIPINAVSVHTVSHPSSQAILFFPLALYLLFRHLTADRSGFALATPFGALFAIVCVGMVLIHPQESMSFLVVLFAVVGVQWIARRWGDYHPAAMLRPVGAHALLMGVVWFAWTARLERAQGRAAFVVETLIEGSAPVGAEAAERGVSLVQLGGSLEELFVKLFAVTLLFCLLAAAVVLYSFRGRFRETNPSDAAVAYLAAALVPLTAGFLAVFLADQGDHYFRFFGFMMVPVVLLGAIGLTRVVTGVDRRVSRGQLTSAIVTVFVVLLALQMLTVHAGPYMYQPNQQVSEHTIEGHAVTFEHHDGETPLLGIRAGQFRYVHAHYGPETVSEEGFPGYRAAVPEHVFNDNVTTHYEDDVLVVITDANYIREVHLYQELRFEAQGFERFEREPEIDRLQDNGEYRLYRVQGQDGGD